MISKGGGTNSLPAGLSKCGRFICISRHHQTCEFIVTSRRTTQSRQVDSRFKTSHAALWCLLHCVAQ